MSTPLQSRFRGLGARILTAVVYGVATLLALWFGAVPTAILFGAMTGLAAREFYAIRHGGFGVPRVVFGVAAATAMPLATALWSSSGMLWVSTLLIVTLIVRHTFIARIRLTETAETLFGALYTGFLLSHFVLIRSHDDGLALALTLIASVWLADVGAYVIGVSFGRRKLAPRISPNKSWEGFFAGTIACVATWLVVPGFFDVKISVLVAVMIGLGVALAAVVGDLFESRLKREVGVKDSGDSLPGHGGFLDRIDSLLFASLVGYWLLKWGGVL